MKNHSVSSSTDLSSRINFSGFWFAEGHFICWLRKMEALHGETWRKAGIFEAIKASAHNIRKNPSLILSVAEKWCRETKSFIFPWGEATITLEDVMVLLGFSVLGSPAFAPLESLEMRDSVEKLEKVRLDCSKTHRNGGRVCVNLWTSRFLGRGDDDEMEHEAFLVLWLSFFVFPGKSRRSISKHVMPIAVRLARGEKIALAPAVLASVYRDLGQIRELARGGMCDGEIVNLKSLFKLVQVWVWERFKDVRPKAREIPKGEPRIALWDNIQQRTEDLRMSFDDFEWRPYTKPLKNWSPFRFYVEEAMWLTIEDSLDDEFKSFARCVRVSQLVGDGFVEDYFPNRVTRQFGLTQDLPDPVTLRRNFTEKEAWDHYSKSLTGSKVYMPSRLARGSVTTRYRDLWLKSVQDFLSSEVAKKESTVDHYDDDDDLDVSPKVLPFTLRKLEKGFPAKLRRTRTCRLAKKYKEPACEDDDDDESLKDEEDDSMTIAQKIRTRKKYYSDAEETEGDDCKSFGRRRRKFQVEDSDDSDSCQKLSSVKMEQKTKEDEENASKTLKTRKLCDDDDLDVSTKVLSLRNVVQILEKGFPTKPRRSRTCRTKYKERACEDDDDESLKDEEADSMSIVQRSRSRKKYYSDAEETGGDGCKSLGKRKRKFQVENSDDSEPCEKLSSVKIKQIRTKEDEESSNETLKTQKLCDDDDEFDVSVSNAEKKTMINDVTEEAESYWLHEVGERQRSNDERWKQRKLAIEELALNVEACMMKVEKTLAMIRKWKTRRNQIQTGVSA